MEKYGILKKIRLAATLVVMLLLAGHVVTTAQTQIVWDQSTAKFVTEGGYARVKRIASGELALVYSAKRDVFIRKSADNGKTWSDPVLVAQTEGYGNTNSEITQLANGWLLYAWNGRPSKRDTTLHYTIMTKISRDNGVTWGDERNPYSGDVKWNNGAWEPATLQLPTGEIQLFFANESPYRETDEQEITMMRSFDNGLTWGEPKQVSFRAGSRDGMPVPLFLKNKKGIVFAIEDNGINGTFKPVIIWSSVADNWKQESADAKSPRRWHALRMDCQLPAPVYAGAPYIVQLPSGETLLSIQSTEGRITNQDKVAIMQVYVGNNQAKDFAYKSTPFPSLPDNANALWNSLAVLDNNTVMAISSVSTGTPEKNGIWIVTGKVLRKKH